MKVQLCKTDEIKESFGGEAGFDYYHRPLTVEERQRINSHIVYKRDGKSFVIDFNKTDVTELLRLAVTKIDRLVDSDDIKVATIEDLLALKLKPGELDNICVTMWVSIYYAQYVSEELKKKP